MGEYQTSKLERMIVCSGAAHTRTNEVARITVKAREQRGNRKGRLSDRKNQVPYLSEDCRAGTHRCFGYRLCPLRT